MSEILGDGMSYYWTLWQSEIAKDYIFNSTGMLNPLKFKYIEKTTAEALVSTISRQFNMNVNIIFANLDWIGGAPLGELISIVSGSKENVAEAIEYMRQKSVGVEVILDA
jgi:ABC-type methionine transport system ATPase subunit